MYTLSIDHFKALTQKVEFRIHPEEVEHLVATLDAKAYQPCGGGTIFRQPGNQRQYEPLIRTPENILRIHHLKKVDNEIEKWKKSGKLWIVSKNQKGMDVNTSAEVAIILFEICEASNNSALNRLKGNIQTHLIENFNIKIEATKLIL